MSHQKCVFCHKVRNKGAQCSFFQIPKNEWARERWFEKCGPVLKKSSIVCQDHFLREDFISPPGDAQIARLLPRAVPCVNIVPVALGTKEEIAASNKSKASGKGGSKKIVEPHFQLINEKLFDELVLPGVPHIDPDELVVPGVSPMDTDELTSTSTFSSAKRNQTYDLRRTACKEVQTGFPHSRTCALVEIDFQQLSYTLHCFYCEEQFALESWTEFVTHISHEHDSLLQKEDDSDDLYSDVNTNFRNEENDEEETPDPHVVIVDELPDEFVFCEICSAAFRDESEVQEHKKAGHLISEFPYKCRICNWLYKKVRCLAAHEATHYEFYCKLCRKPYDTNDEFQAHKEEHKTIGQATYCDLCKKQFETHRRFHIHFRRMHNHPTYTCHFCGKLYTNRTHFISHIKAHKNERDYICDECGMSFVRAKNLKSHKLLHSNDPNRKPGVVCTICQQNFSGYNPLMAHKKQAHFVLEGTIEELEAMVPPVRRHTKVKTIIDPVDNRKRLVCDVCGKTYRHHGGLHRHKKREHNLLPRQYSRKPIGEKQTETVQASATENACVADGHNASIVDEIIDFKPEHDEIVYLDLLDHLENDDTGEEDSLMVEFDQDKVEYLSE